MNELIKITQNENNEQVVSARELYKVLGVKKRFSEWWKQNSQLLVEHEDFEGVPGGTPVIGGNGNVQYLTDYAVTADNAKHLAMQSQTKKSREIRDYFIQVEKDYRKQLELPKTKRELAQLALSANEETAQRVDIVEERVSDLEENTPLSPGDYSYIGRRINQRVSEVARGYGRITQEQRGALYKDINQGVKVVTGVSTRTQLRAKHFDTVLAYINDWEPSTATKMQVRQTSFEFED